MSIKDLFDKGQSLSLLKDKAQDDIREDVESYRYVDAYNSRRDRFFPDTDFATASNFARFGSAELYYENSIKRVYQTYPYDGSLAEKIEWENDSTYLDIFILENEYPRTNGFITVGQGSSFAYSETHHDNFYSSSAPEYVFFKGGPHADPSGDYKNEASAGNSRAGVSKANVYLTGSRQANNLEVDISNGITVEFWLKKDSFASTSEVKKEILFHLWNGSSDLSANPNFGEVRIDLAGDTSTTDINFTLVSGSTSRTHSHNTGLSTIADGEWHHYAFVAKSDGSNLIQDVYIDGVFKNNSKLSDLGDITGPAHVAAIGASAGKIYSSGLGGAAAYGQLVSSSFDEFRFWKKARTAKEIGRDFRAQVGGGTNTDDVKHDKVSNPVDLGVYYKFNEGITTELTTDRVVLDYSGRISNGEYIGYDSTFSRSTGSALVLSGYALREFKDPIIYASHPEVSSLEVAMKASGSMHDYENPSSLYQSMPGWIMEEDEKTSSNLRYFTQIMASYLDDLYLQIRKLPTLRDVNYPYDNHYEKPLPFAERLLTSRGFDAPSLFASAKNLSHYMERDEKVLFEKKLYEVKNTIYQNIYNNLTYIQKSKGTQKSLRNFLRCFGVDEELIKLNIYAKNDVYEFKDNTTAGTVRKRFLDFDDPESRRKSNGQLAESYSATAYQYYDSTNSNSLSYVPKITATEASGAAATIEAEVIFPKRSIVGDSNYALFPSVSSSIFGMNLVLESNTDLTTASVNNMGFNIGVHKSDNDLRNVKFFLDGQSGAMSDLESANSFSSVYDNEKWNLAYRLRPTKYPVSNLTTGSLAPSGSSYTYELYGVNYVSNVLQNEFTISGTISYDDAENFFTTAKRVYAGARRQHFTGSVTRNSDVKVSSVRLWMDYLSDETIRGHARSGDSFGTMHPYENFNIAASNQSLAGINIPQIEKLIFNWELSDVTGSDSNGRFLIRDFSSGSAPGSVKSTAYGWVSDVNKYHYPGRGDNFVTGTDYRADAIDVNFLPIAKRKLPEVVSGDDMVKILGPQDDVLFTKDTTFVQHLLSVEKSMYQVISDEMLRTFATVADFNNLVGEPVNRYRPHYKKMGKLRDLFFSKVQNEPDLDKFIEYFKWIDDAVTMMIAQLIPASSNTVDLLRNMVESHMLERNKYWTKFPTFHDASVPPEGSLKGIRELKYNWKFGHPNLTLDEKETCVWWKQRAKRSDPTLTSGDSQIDSNKENILKIVTTEVTGSEPILKTAAGTKYKGSYYKLRAFSKPVDVVAEQSLVVRSAGNANSANRADYYKGILKFGSDDDFFFIDKVNILDQEVCNDRVTPPELEKKQVNFKSLTKIAADISDISEDYSDVKSAFGLPFSIFSSSLETGYTQQYKNYLKMDFANIHEDKYGFDAEVPMQGPFSERNAGGAQHRHVALNRGTDTRATRVEGWHLQLPIDTDNTTEETLLVESFSANGVSNPYTPRTGSVVDDRSRTEPSQYDKWMSPAGAQFEWNLNQTGPTRTLNTGPSAANSGSYYAFCDVIDGGTEETDRRDKTFGLATPIIDALDMAPSGSDEQLIMSFMYHMYGDGIGTLKVEASTDRQFSSGQTKRLFVRSTQQQVASDSDWKSAQVNLASYQGSRFYIRFHYTAGKTIRGDCAIDHIRVYRKNTLEGDHGSFRLLHPTHDNHNLPYADYMREEYAKRPVVIKNIPMTLTPPLGPTVAGNYHDRYQVVNSVSRETNDPWFRVNADSVLKSSLRLDMLGDVRRTSRAERIPLSSSFIKARLSNATSRVATDMDGASPKPGDDLGLPDRTFISGTTRNRTIFANRFSAPGGFEVMSRGFLDPEHETYSVYNSMPWRNYSNRLVSNAHLQAHTGRFGISTLGATGSLATSQVIASSFSPSARVYNDEVTGTVNSRNYQVVSASVHKYHRNNMERIIHSDPENDFEGSVVITASVYDNAFVSHAIPRLPQQYSWITASLEVPKNHRSQFNSGNFPRD